MMNEGLEHNEAEDSCCRVKTKRDQKKRKEDIKELTYVYKNGKFSVTYRGLYTE
jgi:hypothetical protein